MYAIIEIKDDDIKILPKAPKGENKRVFKFPLGKTLRVDLDEGKVEGLSYYKPDGMKEKLMGAKTSLDKIYINGQIVEDYPATYITLASSLKELENSIVQEKEEEIMEEFTEVRDKNNKKLQDGGASLKNMLSKGFGFIYRKKGGVNPLLLGMINSKANKIIDGALNILGDKLNGKEQKGGAGELKKVKDFALDNTKKIYNVTKNSVNAGMQLINNFAKNTIKFMKGGEYGKAKKEMEKIQKQCKKMKSNYKKGKMCGGSQCGGSQCGGCKPCQYAKKIALDAKKKIFGGKK